MTGIIRVVKASIFSDLNNLKVYSILDDFYSDLSALLEQLDLWEFLLFSGYLTINEKVGEDYVDIYSLRIPNREVGEFFKKKFIDAKFGESL